MNLNVKRSIIAIDLKSFYATCECVDRGLDPFKTPLIVISGNKGAMSLAITPFLKSKGIKSRTRLYDLPKGINYIKVPPRLHFYEKRSQDVINVYKKFVSEEDMHIYSIDEVFIDITNYLTLYKKTPFQIAKMILEEIKKDTGLMAASGIGPNIFMAKVAMDLDAKNSPLSIAEWSFKDIETKLWPLSPLSKVWGIGSNMERRLNRLNIFSIYDLAHFNKNILKDKLGVMGVMLWEHANGIDNTTIKELNKPPKSKSISHSQILYKDYNDKNIEIIIRETIELLTRRLRISKLKTSSVSLSISYSKSVGGGFTKRITLDNKTDDFKEIHLICMSIFDKYYDYLPIRQVSISLGELTKEEGKQLSLFKDINDVIKDESANDAIDSIKDKYGANSLLKASSLLEDSTIIERNRKIN